MRFVKSLILGGLSLVPLATLTPGCVENESSFFIERALYLDPESDCTFEVDLPSYPTGTLDLAIGEANETGSSYSIVVAAANQLQALGDPDLLRTETSYIRLEGAEVTIEGLSGAPSVGAFTVPLSDTIPPSSGADPGRTPVSLLLVPNGAIEEEGKFLIHIRLFGHTLGGTPIEAGEFVWPLEVCRNCLRVCDLEAFPPCAFQIGADYAHSCALYGADGCDKCADATP